MLKKNLALAAAIIGAVAVLSIPAMTTAAKAKPAAKIANDGRAQCYECHDEVKALKEGSKHAKLSCNTCHDNMAAHMKDPEKNKPVTIIDQALCGKCTRASWTVSTPSTVKEAPAKKKASPAAALPCRTNSWLVTVSHSSMMNHADTPSW